MFVIGSVHEEIKLITAVEVTASLTWAWWESSSVTDIVQKVEDYRGFISFWISATVLVIFVSVCATSYFVFSRNSERVVGASIWAAVLVIVWVSYISNI